MKATGIVRRIDDLGRVVIPKEIRRTLRIREGDPLEIFTDREGEVILKNTPLFQSLANLRQNMQIPCMKLSARRRLSATGMKCWRFRASLKKII